MSTVRWPQLPRFRQLLRYYPTSRRREMLDL
jgi:hypothetical protein